MQYLWIRFTCAKRILLRRDAVQVGINVQKFQGLLSGIWQHTR